jgi:hypothetical protein
MLKSSERTTAQAMEANSIYPMAEADPQQLNFFVRLKRPLKTCMKYLRATANTFFNGRSLA